jgi:hypothetical protein
MWRTYIAVLPLACLTAHQNVSLLFNAVPEFEKFAKTVWPEMADADDTNDALGTAESRVRFENLLTDILTELAATKLVTFVSPIRE